MGALLEVAAAVCIVSGLFIVGVSALAVCQRPRPSPWQIWGGLTVGGFLLLVAAALMEAPGVIA